MRRVLPALLVLLPAIALAQSAPEPLPVVYIPDGAAEEGCRMQWQTSAAVRAYSAPTPVSSHIRTIDGLRRVDANDYTEALTAVLRNGRARARGDVRVTDAFNLTTGRTGPLVLPSGEEVDLLSRGPEGTGYFFHRGDLYLGTLSGFSVITSGAGVDVMSEPVTELWVRLVEHGEDRPAAWLNVSQAGVVGRESSCGG